MSSLSNFYGGGGSYQDEIDGVVQQMEQLSAMLTGSEISLPPETVEPNSGLLEKNGALVNKSTYATLWAWVQANGLSVTSAQYDSIVSASPLNACSKYADVDTTTFRIPTIGLGGFSRAVGALGETPLGTIDGGFGSQVEEHQHAENIFTGGSTSQTIVSSSGTGQWGTSDNVVIPNETVITGSGQSGLSRPATLTSPDTYNNTGETSPQGVYNKVFIFTGNIVSNLPTPEPDWLAQQDTNTNAIAKVTTDTAHVVGFPTPWVNIGTAGHATFAGVATDNRGEITCRWESEDLYRMKGIVRFNAQHNSGQPVFNLPTGYESAQAASVSQFVPTGTNSNADGAGYMVILDASRTEVDYNATIPSGGWVMFDISIWVRTI